jgi:hypothetical protein
MKLEVLSDMLLATHMLGARYLTQADIQTWWYFHMTFLFKTYCDMSQGKMSFSGYSYLGPTLKGMSSLSYPYARQVSPEVPAHADFRGGKSAVLRDARKGHFIICVAFEIVQIIMLFLD